ncbi:MAG: hypothetical protein K9L73_02385 [Spirochaetia bacterium]|nr:hypothetical protein [Spirochaetia bacterium]
MTHHRCRALGSCTALSCLCHPETAACHVILGFLRRYVLLPARSLPQSEEEHTQMLIDLKRLSCALFSELGMDLDRVPRAPKEPFTHVR